ncbi:hypothetical protein R3P38DRAFT_765542 [Favolaschia claudopus]|uniref:Uncharacterized protein n=1 Tax=Favolaschia claudopus TaxID=2862362 RepID=A0AAV9Z387_9AGAR
MGVVGRKRRGDGGVDRDGGMESETMAVMEQTRRDEPEGRGRMAWMGRWCTANWWEGRTGRIAHPLTNKPFHAVQSADLPLSTRKCLFTCAPQHTHLPFNPLLIFLNRPRPSPSDSTLFLVCRYPRTRRRAACFETMQPSRRLILLTAVPVQLLPSTSGIEGRRRGRRRRRGRCGQVHRDASVYELVARGHEDEDDSPCVSTVDAYFYPTQIHTLRSR